jgi:peptidyl-dipeptidase Dcp
MTKLSASPSAATQSASGGNPLLEAWQTPFETPPFARILPDHFLPAFTAAFAKHDAEIVAIKANGAEPTFENTVAALERSGRLLTPPLRRTGLSRPSRTRWRRWSAPAGC